MGRKKRKKKIDDTAPAEPATELSDELTSEPPPQAEAAPQELEPEFEPSAPVEAQEESPLELVESSAAPPATAATGDSFLVRWWRRLVAPQTPEAEPAAAEIPPPLSAVEEAPWPEATEPWADVGVTQEEAPVPAPVEASPPAAAEEQTAGVAATLAADSDVLKRQREEKESLLESLRRELRTAHSDRRAERDAAAVRVNELQTALAQSHAELEAAHQKVGALESRSQPLEADVARQKQLVLGLEEKLDDLAQRLSAKEAELSAVRSQPDLVNDLQEKLDRLGRQLAAKDGELTTLRAQSNRELDLARTEAKQALARARDLEAALSQAAARAMEVQAELAAQKAQVERLLAEKSQLPVAAPTAQPPPAPVTAAFLSPQKAEEFYHKTVSPLTVITASADLLAMSPKLDPSLREMAVEVRRQSAALMELIKKLTQPPGPSGTSGS